MVDVPWAAVALLIVSDVCAVSASVASASTSTVTLLSSAVVMPAMFAATGASLSGLTLTVKVWMSNSPPASSTFTAIVCPWLVS